MLAPASGTVTFAGTVPSSGKSVTIATSDGFMVTLTHLGSIAAREGATIVEGDPTGTVGPSGDPELAQPYVHLGVRIAAQDQGYVDPLSVLPGGVRTRPPGAGTVPRRRPRRRLRLPAGPLSRRRSRHSRSQHSRSQRNLFRHSLSRHSLSRHSLSRHSPLTRRPPRRRPSRRRRPSLPARPNRRYPRSPRRLALHRLKPRLSSTDGVQARRRHALWPECVQRRTPVLARRPRPVPCAASTGLAAPASEAPAPAGRPAAPGPRARRRRRPGARSPSGASVEPRAKESLGVPPSRSVRWGSPGGWCRPVARSLGRTASRTASRMVARRMASTFRPGRSAHVRWF